MNLNSVEYYIVIIFSILEFIVSLSLILFKNYSYYDILVEQMNWSKNL